MALKIEQVNALGIDKFVEVFGDVAEHSPWVAEGAAESRPYASRVDMIEAFATTLSAASQTAQLALINAHPDLAGKAKLTVDSKNEQAGAGLDSLTDEEMRKFTQLNDQYKGKFKFPFIFAVKGSTKYMILDSFEQRINNNLDIEFATALENIKRIFSFRIEDQVK